MGRLEEKIFKSKENSKHLRDKLTVKISSWDGAYAGSFTTILDEKEVPIYEEKGAIIFDTNDYLSRASTSLRNLTKIYRDLKSMKRTTQEERYFRKLNSIFN